MSFDALDISASALYTQRLKMDTVASNIANVNTTRNPDGTPGAYRRKQVAFQAVYNNVSNQYASSPENNDFELSFDKTLKGNVSFNTPQVANGVTINQITEDSNTPLRRVYDPSHPDAGKDGYVEMPNVNIVTEMVDMISASRAYEANITAIDTTKNMLSSALRI